MYRSGRVPIRRYTKSYSIDLFYFIQMLIIVTGEMDASDSEELKKHAQTLRSRGVDVVTIGTGEVDTAELEVVTRPLTNMRGDTRIWLSKDLKAVSQYAQDVSDFACSEGMWCTLIEDVMHRISRGVKFRRTVK